MWFVLVVCGWCWVIGLIMVIGIKCVRVWFRW